MAHYRIGEDLHDIDLFTWPNSELSAVQRALGCSVEKVAERLDGLDVDAIQAIIWIFRRRTEPSLRIDAVQFTLYDFIDALEFSDDEVRDLYQAIEADDPDKLAAERAEFIAGKKVTDEQRSRMFADGLLIEEPLVPLALAADPDIAELGELKREYGADFAHLYGIRPWEWALLTYGETLGLAAAVEKYRSEVRNP